MALDRVIFERLRELKGGTGGDMMQLVYFMSLGIHSSVNSFFFSPPSLPT